MKTPMIKGQEYLCIKGNGKSYISNNVYTSDSDLHLTDEQGIERNVDVADFEPFIDLFEHQDLLPENVRDMLLTFDSDAEGYSECRKLEAELNQLGYTFDWGLDASPYYLRKMEACILIPWVVDEQLGQLYKVETVSGELACIDYITLEDATNNITFGNHTIIKY